MKRCGEQLKKAENKRKFRQTGHIKIQMEFTNENGFLFFATIRPMINGWSFKCTKNLLRSTAEKYVAYVCRCR